MQVIRVWLEYHLRWFLTCAVFFPVSQGQLAIVSDQALNISISLFSCGTTVPAREKQPQQLGFRALTGEAILPELNDFWASQRLPVAHVISFDTQNQGIKPCLILWTETSQNSTCSWKLPVSQVGTITYCLGIELYNSLNVRNCKP